MDSLIRPAAVAGSFYPADVDALKTTIQSYLCAVQGEELTPKALIIPHAGYIYSGPIAATAYKLLEKMQDSIKKVILLGPAHTVAFHGIAVPEAHQFATPLGNVIVDQESKSQLDPLEFVVESDVPHEFEHSLEVQLPFIQQVLPQAKVLPMVVGIAEGEQVSDVLKILEENQDTLILISSDLSHYHSDEEAKKIDGHTALEIENLDSQQLSGEKACGYIAIKGLLNYAKEKHWQCKVLDLRNSSDTAGDKSRVVGYGAFAFYE